MNDRVKQELCLLIGHYIRDKNPEIYHKFADLCKEKRLLMDNCQNLDDQIDHLYGNLDPDQFLLYLSTLTPDDDFPSLFRRMNLFQFPPRFTRTADLRLLTRDRTHSDSVFTLLVDPLSRFFASASDDSTICIWSLPNFEKLCVLRGHRHVISNIAINLDISLLISASHDSTVRIWSLNTGENVAVLSGFTDKEVHNAIFSPNGKLIAACCEDGSLAIWETEAALTSPKPLNKILAPQQAAVIWAAFSPGSEFIVFSAEPSRVIVISLSSSRRYELKLHTTMVNYVSFSKRLYPCCYGMAPRVLTVSAEDGIAAIWALEPNGFVPIHTFKNITLGRKSSKIISTQWDCDDHLLVIIRNKNSAIYDTISGATVNQLPETEITTDLFLVACHPKIPELFALVSAHGILSVWNLYDLQLFAAWHNEHINEFVEITWSPCGRYIILSDNKGEILLFQFEFGAPIQNPPFQRFSTHSSMNFEIKTNNLFTQNNEKFEGQLVTQLLDHDNQINEGYDEDVLPIHIDSPPEIITTTNVLPFNPLNYELSEQSGDEKEEIKSDDDYIPAMSPHIEQQSDDEEEDILEMDEELSMLGSMHYSTRQRSKLPSPADPSNFTVHKPFDNNNRPRWLIAIASTVYVPQIGDDIIYIHSLNKTGMPNLPFNALPLFSRGIIINLSINDKGFFVSLQIAQSFPLQIMVFYPMTDYCDFFMPTSYFGYYHNLAMSLRPGSVITYRFKNEMQTGNVLRVRNCDIINNVCVNNEVISVFQIFSINDFPIKPEIYRPNTMPIAEAFEKIAWAEIYETFYDIDKLVLPNIVQPIDLRMIIARLRNGWYRTDKALYADLNLMDQLITALQQKGLTYNVFKQLMNQIFDVLKRPDIKICFQARHS